MEQIVVAHLPHADPQRNGQRHDAGHHRKAMTARANMR